MILDNIGLVFYSYSLCSYEQLNNLFLSKIHFICHPRVIKEKKAENRETDASQISHTTHVTLDRGRRRPIQLKSCVQIKNQ